MDGDSEYELVCPLCCEDIDLEDKYFRPCPCGYQICRFCWNKIYEETNRLCPACRREYDKESVQFTPVPADELARLKKRKAQRLKKKEDKVDVVSSALPRPSRPAPPSKDVKVIQKNLVYVTGVPSSKANEDMLRSHDYFGQFGKIVKLVIHRKLPPSLQTHDPQVSVYITYANPQSAAQAIAFLDGAYVVGEARPLRASFGTTKYCASFLSGRSCTNRDCVYLHEYGEEVEDVSSVTGPRMPQGGPIRILGQGEQAKAANGAQVTAVAVAAVPSARDADAGPILPPTASWASRKPNMSAREAKTLRQASASPSGNMSDNDFPTMEEATAGTGAASESGSAAQQIAQTKPRKKKQKIKEQVPDPPLEEVPPNTGHDTRQDHHPTNAAPETPADELRQPAVRRTTPVADIASVVLEAFPPHVPIIRPITRPGSPASENGWPDTQPVSAYATRSPTPHSIREPMWPPRSSRWVLQALQAAPATPQKYEGGFNPFDAGDVMADILNDRACGADVSRADGSTPSLAPSMRLPPQWSGPGIPPGQSLLRGAGPAAAAGRPFMGSAPTGQAMHRLPFPSAPNFTGASVEPYSQPHPRPGLVQEPFQLGNGGHPPADYQGRLLSFALGSGQVPPPQPSLLDDFQRHRRMTEATIAPETLRQGPPGFDRTHALSAIREPGASSKPPQFTDDFNTLFPNVKVTYAPPPVSGSLASRVLNAPPGLQSGLRVHAEAEARDLPTRTFDPFNERGPGAPRTADSQAPAVPGRTRSALDAQDILKQFLQAQELTKSSTTARGAPSTTVPFNDPAIMSMRMEPTAAQPELTTGTAESPPTPIKDPKPQAATATRDTDTIGSDGVKVAQENSQNLTKEQPLAAAVATQPTEVDAASPKGATPSLEAAAVTTASPKAAKEKAKAKAAAAKVTAPVEKPRATAGQSKTSAAAEQDKARPTTASKAAAAQRTKAAGATTPSAVPVPPAAANSNVDDSKQPPVTSPVRKEQLGESARPPAPVAEEQVQGAPAAPGVSAAVVAKKKKKKKGKAEEPSETPMANPPVAPVPAEAEPVQPAALPTPSRVTINGIDFAPELFTSPEVSSLAAVNISNAASYLEKLGISLDTLLHDATQASLASMAKNSTSASVSVDFGAYSFDIKSFFDPSTAFLGSTGISPPPPPPPGMSSADAAATSTTGPNTNRPAPASNKSAGSSFSAFIDENEMKALEQQYQNAKKEAAMWEQKLKQIMKKNKKQHGIS